MMLRLIHRSRAKELMTVVAKLNKPNETRSARVPKRAATRFN